MGTWIRTHAIFFFTSYVFLKHDVFIITIMHANIITFATWYFIHRTMYFTFIIIKQYIYLIKIKNAATFLFIFFIIKHNLFSFPKIMVVVRDSGRLHSMGSSLIDPESPKYQEIKSYERLRLIRSNTRVRLKKR